MRLQDFKALTFDCYGTLIDSGERHSRRLRNLAETDGRHRRR